MSPLGAGIADDAPKSLTQPGKLDSQGGLRRLAELPQHPSSATLEGARTPSPPLLRDADKHPGDCEFELELHPSGRETPPRLGTRTPQAQPSRRGRGAARERPSRKDKLQYFHASAAEAGTAAVDAKVPSPGLQGRTPQPAAKPVPSLAPPAGFEQIVPPGLVLPVAHGLEHVSDQGGLPDYKGAAANARQPARTDLSASGTLGSGSLSSGGADVDAEKGLPAGGRMPWLSAGSVGHPYSCATACRYIKRKGGCRVAAACPHCHLCFWRRDADAETDGVAQSSLSGKPVTSRSDVISVGSQGHPDTCGPPCRYARRKDGCRNGRECTNCHICLWRRDAQSDAQLDTQDAQAADVLVDMARHAAPEAQRNLLGDEGQSLFGEEGQNLQKMIVSLLQTQSSGVPKSVEEDQQEQLQQLPHSQLSWQPMQFQRQQQQQHVDGLQVGQQRQPQQLQLAAGHRESHRDTGSS